jgi:hypothetical protein
MGSEVEDDAAPIRKAEWDIFLSENLIVTQLSRYYMHFIEPDNT